MTGGDQGGENRRQAQDHARIGESMVGGGIPSRAWFFGREVVGDRWNACLMQAQESQLVGACLSMLR